ncbi:unnamed protein product [Rotaria socialis]|uniref:F-box domain-containing protein n=2 Tax=Rotaria socialis TaxID=392032 RepID=A0A818U5C3_9BILA|nr:unnamed protein product [Rotaria socialis]
MRYLLKKHPTEDAKLEPLDAKIYGQMEQCLSVESEYFNREAAPLIWEMLWKPKLKHLGEVDQKLAISISLREKSRTTTKTLNYRSMSKVITGNVSKLETLSNELLVDIFEYVAPRDLMYGLWSLNHRLNGIVSSSKICLKIFKRYHKSSSQVHDELEIFKFFAPHIYSLHIDYADTHVDLHQCSQLLALEMWSMDEQYSTAIRPSIMPYLERLVTRDYIWDHEHFFHRLATEPFALLTTLKFGDLEFEPKANYKPLIFVRSVSGICCMWDDFNNVLAVFPQLRRLSLSLYAYRENPRWGSIAPLKLTLNNLSVKFSSEMVTPDDDPPFHLMINTRLRHVKLNASISRQNDNLLLIDILPPIVQRIENVIEQNTNEEMNADNNHDNLEALVEAHLACQNIYLCNLYMSDVGWGYIDTES